MKFFIINLPHDNERRERMVRCCGELGLDFEIVEAIDGKSLSPSELTAAQGYDAGEVGAAMAQDCGAKCAAAQNPTQPRRKKPLSPGEISCALSHRKALARLLELGLPHAVIFEDDAVFGGELVEFLRLVPRFPPELELLLLGHYRQVYLDDGFRVESPFSLRYDFDFGEGHHLKRLVGGGLGAHGYFVTAQGAARLLAASERIWRPYDHYTSDDAAVNVFALYPVVVEFELGGASAVQTARNKKKRPLIAKLFKRLRKCVMFFPRSLMPLRKYEVNGDECGGGVDDDNVGGGERG